MRASLHTIGCRLNQAETALLADGLRRRGYDVVRHGQATDLFVLNTCAVTDNAERECRYEIRRALRHSPHAFVAVTGCYAQTGGHALSAIPGIDLILGTAHKMKLPEYVPAPDALRKRPAPALVHTRTIGRDDFVETGVGDCDSTRANLKIQDGCNVMCAFCIIPFARGHERSREFDDVLREAADLAAKGHREVVLTGVNLGQYRHHGQSLVELIAKLEAIEGIERIRISSIEPTTVTEELLDLMQASRKLCRHLHVPLQSGDDAVLRGMNRPYTILDFRRLAERALSRVPGLALGTDVMVGFPMEGESEFARTRTFLQTLPFAYCHVFSFSKRPGTAAARLPHSVAPATIRRRSRLLAEDAHRQRQAFYRRHVGTVVQVLFEVRDSSGYWTGLTDNYVRVGVRSEVDSRNRLMSVLITGLMDGLAVGEVVTS